MECAFCELKEIKERIFTESEFAMAFPTNIPITIGHSLIIPKRCVAKIEDLKKEELLDIFALAEKVKAALKRSFGAEGFNVAYNEGKVAGQSVPHFHLHIVPRKEGDSGIYEYEPRKFLYRPGSREKTEQAELLKVSREIAKNMS